MAIYIWKYINDLIVAVFHANYYTLENNKYSLDVELLLTDYSENSQIYQSVKTITDNSYEPMETLDLGW